MALNNNSNEYVSFIMGGMHFEYDEAKNQKNIEKHGILSKVQLVCSLIMIELKCMMRKIVILRIGMIPSVIYLQEL